MNLFIAWDIKPDLNSNIQVCQQTFLHPVTELRMESSWINIIKNFIIIILIIEIIL